MCEKERMIGFPISSNSVYISAVPAGCCKVEFDMTYPVHLNGIISRDEYRDSITRINRSISSNMLLIITIIIFFITMILGTIFYILGGVTSTSSDRYTFSPFFIIGIVLTTCGSVLFAIVSVLIQLRRVARLRKAVAEESMKYSTRSSIPCSWRLETANYFFGRYSNRSRGQLTGHIVIDIGRPIVPGNGVYYTQQGVNESGMFSRISDPSAPPPYSNQRGEGCIQCGVPRHDLRAKFCSSCGHAFEKH